jgi:hypothetical protein
VCYDGPYAGYAAQFHGTFNEAPIEAGILTDLSDETLNIKILTTPQHKLFPGYSEFESGTPSGYESDLGSFS